MTGKRIILFSSTFGILIVIVGFWLGGTLYQVQSSEKEIVITTEQQSYPIEPVVSEYMPPDDTLGGGGFTMPAPESVEFEEGESEEFVE